MKVEQIDSTLVKQGIVLKNHLFASQMDAGSPLIGLSHTESLLGQTLFESGCLRLHQLPYRPPTLAFRDLVIS